MSSMHSRRDQVQAYQFVTRRIGSALLLGDANATEQPVRRMARFSFASILVAALAVAGITVYGLVRPGGNTGWRDGGSLILEKETGTRYVYLNGQLHPVLNFTSARLILGTAEPPITSVSTSSLRGVPRGAPMGIPGAPDYQLSATDLVRTPWTVCSQPAHDANGTSRPWTTLTGGVRPPAGDHPLGDGDGLLVVAPDTSRYLVWHGTLLRVADASVLPAINFDGVPAMPVSAAWLGTVPPGPDLAPLNVTGLGQPGPSLDGQPTRIGQVFVAGDQYYLLDRGGLRPLTPLQAAIQLADPRTRSVYPPDAARAAQVSPGAVSSARSANAATAGNDLPVRPPHPVDTTASASMVCAVDTDPANASATVTVTLRPADPALPAPPTAVPVDPLLGGPLADVASLTPGSSALIRAAPSPGSTAGTLYVVTDVGVKYALSGNDVQSVLGLSGATPVALPAAYAQLLHTGPRLDAGDAARTVPADPGAPAASPSPS